MLGTILVTGAGGFIGRRIVGRLIDGGYRVRAVEHRRAATRGSGVEAIRADLVDTASHQGLVAGIDVVLHLAGRAHVSRETAVDAAGEYRAINVDSTQSLAKAAAASGARRFVFVSTVGVHGDEAGPDDPITENHPIRPVSQYARSKWEAEQTLLTVTSRNSMELTILRPALIYGAGAPGNIARLRRAIGLRTPLPLGMVDNCRSLLSLEAFSDLLLLAATQPAAAGEVFVASDERCLSTPEIAAALARGLGCRPVMLPVPVKWLRVGSRIIRQRSLYTSLCESLVIDPTRARERLGWRSAGDPRKELERVGAAPARTH